MRVVGVAAHLSALQDGSSDSLAVVASQDTVASRVEALYDKIRDKEPAKEGPSRESGVRVQSNTQARVELIENQVLISG